MLLCRQQDETSVLFLRELARQQQATIDRKLRYVDFRGHLVVALAVTGDQGSVRDIAAAMQDRKCHPALRKHLLLLVASNLCGQPELMRALYNASQILPDHDSWVAQGKCIDHMGENLACDKYHLVVDATSTLAHCFKIPFDCPATRYPTAEELSRVRSAAAVRSLDQLDEPCREIIQLRYFGELTYDEISRTLDLNPKTVSSRLSKCLDRLEGIARKVFARGKPAVSPSNR